MTVAGWVKKRFEPSFPGHSVDVLHGDGRKAAGRALLETVRGAHD